MAEEDKNNFGSFADLARSMGVNPDDTPDGGDGTGGSKGGEWETRLGGLRSHTREVIESAGDGFGPMATGPDCYRDPGSEEMELLASFRIRTVFPEPVETAASELPRNPDPADFVSRQDLRGERIFTIDGEDAKDFDDAIQITPLDDGAVEVGVHIADVGHYVRPGNELDTEALARGTSVYLPDQVIPMLPEALSNHLCSLVPGCDRLAFSVKMVFDAEGQRESYDVHKSVIKSVHRCTYKIVQQLLDGEDNGDTRALGPIAEDLRLFETWTKRQQLLRDRKGSLRMQSSERKFKFDAEHEVEKIYPSETYFSQTLIEETALAANQAVGDYFKQRDLPTIYRVHPRKDQEEIDAVTKMLGQFGIRVPNKDRLTGRDVGRLIRECRRRPNAEALIGRVMGLVERASYEVAKAEDTAEHWGLAREHYLHFTSPIRRYPDLIVHRWLHDVISRRGAAESELLAPQQVEGLTDVAGHCSVQSDLAGMVENALDDLKVCQYMDRFREQVLKAVLRRVSPAGLEVFLEEHYVTGFIPARLLPGRKKVEGPRMTIQSRQGTRVFVEGSAIEIRVTDIDFVRLQVLLDIVT
ncbi:MAG: RNB domain-containing ribonuclease [Planctomycetes bacterium]|nr:RNB domain-containing ribonuclease [Planctomycetota bacterium]